MRREEHGGAGRGAGKDGTALAGWACDTFMGRLRPVERDAVLALGCRRAYSGGAALVREGEVDTHGIILLSGRVRVTVTDADGRVTLLGTRGAGDIVGEMALVDGPPRSATATAVGEVQGVVITAASMDFALRRHQGVSRALLVTLSQYVRLANRRSQHGQRTVPARLASTLIDLARREGERTPDGTVVRMTRGELAQHVGAAEVTIIKILTSFNRRGLVCRRRGAVTILRPEELSAVANCP